MIFIDLCYDYGIVVTDKKQPREESQEWQKTYRGIKVKSPPVIDGNGTQLANITSSRQWLPKNISPHSSILLPITNHKAAGLAANLHTPQLTNT